MPSPEGTLYDNPEQTVTVLRGFWLAHSEQLKKIPMKFPEALMKYDTTLQVFAEAHGRVTSLGGRETMDFMSVRQIIEDDDNDEDQDELDEVVLSSFKYTRAFRRKYFFVFLSLFFSLSLSLSLSDDDAFLLLIPFNFALSYHASHLFPVTLYTLTPSHPLPSPFLFLHSH